MKIGGTGRIQIFHALTLFFASIWSVGSLSADADMSGSCPNGEGGCPGSGGGTKCPLTPSSYEGPFFLPNQPVRSDIREGKPGIPVKIEFHVKDTRCQSVPGVEVHLWQCDAMGVYSAYSGYYPLGDPKAKPVTHPHSEPTEEATFLRGIQTADNGGVARFTTIYPGWYRYRALHVHFKVTHQGRDKYTGELYFPDSLTDQVAQVEPYKTSMEKRLKNEDDGQYLHDHGEMLLIHPQGNVQDGFVGKIQIVIPDL